METYTVYNLMQTVNHNGCNEAHEKLWKYLRDDKLKDYGLHEAIPTNVVLGVIGRDEDAIAYLKSEDYPTTDVNLKSATKFLKELQCPYCRGDAFMGLEDNIGYNTVTKKMEFGIFCSDCNCDFVVSLKTASMNVLEINTENMDY